MKFSIGDPIRVKTTGEEGKIGAFIDEKTAKIITENNTFQVFIDDLEHPYLQWFLNPQKEKINTENSIEPKSTFQEGIYLVLFPIYQTDEFDKFISSFKIHLRNEIKQDYLYSFQIQKNGKTIIDVEGEITINSEFYLCDISFEDLSKSPIFQYSFSQKTDDSYLHTSYITLKPKKLSQYLHKIRHENNPTFSILLTEKVEKKPIIPSPSLPAENSQKVFNDNIIVKNPESKYEIDLHIEKLRSDYETLTSEEKLRTQLSEFINHLELAISLNQRSIVFIHGIGKGTLKNEIHKILEQKKKKNQIRIYMNNYDVRYGYGATEVYIQ